MLARVLLEKTEIKKCYNYSQQRGNMSALSSNPIRNMQPCLSSNHMTMRTQNEYTKRNRNEYRDQYFEELKSGFDEVKVTRMSAYFVNQFSQKIVQDKSKKPNEHLQDFMVNAIDYERDMPKQELDSFKSHKFLFMFKNSKDQVKKGLKSQGKM